MKKLMIILGVLSSLLLFACAEDSNLISPVSDLSLEESDLFKVNWISLPPELSVERGSKPLKSTDKINGKNGGKLGLEEEFGSGRKKIKITAMLEFPEGSFDGEKDVSMVLEDQYGTVVFSPHSEFIKPALYNLKIEGLDLKGIEKSKVKFVYMAENGTLEEVECTELKVGGRGGVLEVKGAKLPHFSRFGFVK